MKTSEKSSTLIIPEPGHHQVFNSTILESGFYLQLQEHRDPTTNQHTRLGFKDIEALCRYMYNRTVDELMHANILDRYMRLRVEPDTIPDMLKEYFGLVMDTTDISELLYEALIEQDKIVFSDWTRIYPKSMKSLAFTDIAKRLLSDVPWFTYRRKNDRASMIVMKMEWLLRDALRTSISYDTQTGYYIYETEFKNQFGNSVKLVISSNSNRMNQIMENLDRAINTAADLKIMVGKTKTLASEHKLLCSFIIDPKTKKGETANDHFSTREIIQEENREVG